jgi:hypothetical protein
MYDRTGVVSKCVGMEDKIRGQEGDSKYQSVFVAWFMGCAGQDTMLTP